MSQGEEQFRNNDGKKKRETKKETRKKENSVNCFHLLFVVLTLLISDMPAMVHNPSQRQRIQEE